MRLGRKKGDPVPDGIEIKFDQTKIEAVVQAAILDQLDEAKKDAILAQAIQYLITAPAKSTYDYGRTPVSPIQAAFNQAVSTVAQRIALEMVTANATIEREIREAIGKVVIDRATSDYAERVLSDALAAIFAKDR